MGCDTTLPLHLQNPVPLLQFQRPASCLSSKWSTVLEGDSIDLRENRSADVMVGSPLNVISYQQNGTGSPASLQSFRIYYQSAIGNIKEAISNGLASWQSAQWVALDTTMKRANIRQTHIHGCNQQYRACHCHVFKRDEPTGSAFTTKFSLKCASVLIVRTRAISSMSTTITCYRKRERSSQTTVFGSKVHSVPSSKQ